MIFRRPSGSPLRSMFIGFLLIGVIIAGILALTHRYWSQLLFDVTGEEALIAQVRGGFEWLGNVTRRQPHTEDMVPIADAGGNPFGVNTFLEQEVEPDKRELAMRMIAAAGFRWIRQEFPWEDIEIHGKGDFQDRRHEPHRSAWAKYDHIVDLSEQYDIEIIARLSNPPAWSRTRGDTDGPFAPSDDLADYGDFVEAVVRRYHDRITTYQIWNEPNIYPEWGERPVDPAGYTELLKVGYARVKAVCPECIVVSGALAQTIPLGPRDLNDFVFLQRMYNAGAGSYFDVLAVQGYGLWSGPTDRRMRPRVLNFSRPLYIREIMVHNGDAHKPIWITEMNWNAPPPSLPNKAFGFVTAEEQARYAVLAYKRAQREWPWVGTVCFWFFKRATDAEQDQAMYYFRLVEPDFTPTTTYGALQEYMLGDEARTLYRGVHQEDHWALTYEGPWETRAEPTAEFGAVRQADPDSASTLQFTFEGRSLWLKSGLNAGGTVLRSIDGAPLEEVSLEGGGQILLARGLTEGPHSILLRAGSGSLAIDSLTVRARAPIRPPLAAGAVLLAVALIAALVASTAVRRNRWHLRGRGRP